MKSGNLALPDLRLKSVNVLSYFPRVSVFVNLGVSVFVNRGENMPTAISLEERNHLSKRQCSVGWYLSSKAFETLIFVFFGIQPLACTPPSWMKKIKWSLVLLFNQEAPLNKLFFFVSSYDVFEGGNRANWKLKKIKIKKKKIPPPPKKKNELNWYFTHPSMALTMKIKALSSRLHSGFGGKSDE